MIGEDERRESIPTLAILSTVQALRTALSSVRETSRFDHLTTGDRLCKWKDVAEIIGHGSPTVQFMKVVDRKNIQIEIWERGTGYTLASGSSSTSAAAVAFKLGLCDSDIAVHMPGGDIHIRFGNGFAATMTGPATKICRGHFPMSGRRWEIQLIKPRHRGHFKPAAVYAMAS